MSTANGDEIRLAWLMARYRHVDINGTTFLVMGEQVAFSSAMPFNVLDLYIVRVTTRDNDCFRLFDSVLVGGVVLRERVDGWMLGIDP